MGLNGCFAFSVRPNLIAKPVSLLGFKLLGPIPLNMGSLVILGWPFINFSLLLDRNTTERNLEITSKVVGLQSEIRRLRFQVMNTAFGRNVR